MTSEQPRGNIPLLLSGIGAFILFLLVEVLVFSSAAQSLDAQLALATYDTHLGSTLAQVMVLSSKYGREYLWIPIVAIMGTFGRRKTKVWAIELAVLFVAGVVAGDLIKIIAFRPRPFNTVPSVVARIPEDSDSSFPSGHAVIVSIGAIFLLIASFYRASGNKARIASILLVMEAAVVCYSRIYLGLHYPLDVLGGIALAAAIALAGMFILERYLGRLTSRGTNLIEKSLAALHIPEFL